VAFKREAASGRVAEEPKVPFGSVHPSVACKLSRIISDKLRYIESKLGVWLHRLLGVGYLAPETWTFLKLYNTVYYYSCNL
jgi:hypothetical protein